MLNQLIVTSVAAGARRPRSARRIALAKPSQFHIKNNVTLKGYVGKDAQSFATKNQTILVRFSLAVKSGYKDRQTQQWVNRTEWHRIVAFGKPADYAKTLKKGDYVQVEGDLRSREYDSKKTDAKQRSWSIKVDSILKLDRAEKAAPEERDDEFNPEEEAA